jgi:hypothetical protein
MIGRANGVLNNMKLVHKDCIAATSTVGRGKVRDSILITPALIVTVATLTLRRIPLNTTNGNEHE